MFRVFFRRLGVCGFATCTCYLLILGLGYGSGHYKHTIVLRNVNMVYEEI